MYNLKTSVETLLNKQCNNKNYLKANISKIYKTKIFKFLSSTKYFNLLKYIIKNYNFKNQRYNK